MTIDERVNEQLYRYGANLRRARESQHLSQIRLGKMSGISNVCISHIETGLRPPNARTMLTLCNALGVGLDEMLEECHEKV